MLSFSVEQVERNCNPNAVTVKCGSFPTLEIKDISSLSLHNGEIHSLAGEIDRQASYNLGCKRV